MKQQITKRNCAGVRNFYMSLNYTFNSVKSEFAFTFLSCSYQTSHLSFLFLSFLPSFALLSSCFIPFSSNCIPFSLYFFLSFPVSLLPLSYPLFFPPIRRLLAIFFASFFFSFTLLKFSFPVFLFFTLFPIIMFTLPSSVFPCLHILFSSASLSQWVQSLRKWRRSGSVKLRPAGCSGCSLPWWATRRCLTHVKAAQEKCTTSCWA